MLACNHVLGVCVGAVVSVAAVGLAVAAAPDVSLVLAPAASVPAASGAADAALAVVGRPRRRRPRRRRRRRHRPQKTRKNKRFLQRATALLVLRQRTQRVLLANIVG